MAATTLVIWLGAFVYFSPEIGHFFTAFFFQKNAGQPMNFIFENGQKYK